MMTEWEWLGWASISAVACVASYITGRLRGPYEGMKEVLDKLGIPDPFTRRDKFL